MHRTVIARSGCLARLPLTWQFVAAYYDYQAPWVRDLDLIRFEWSPLLRMGRTRADLANDLAELEKTRSYEVGERLLAANFAGGSLEDLFTLIRGLKLLHAPADWWALLPIPEEVPADIYRRFRDHRNGGRDAGGSNFYSKQQMVMAALGQQMFQAAMAFTVYEPKRKVEQAEERATGHYIESGGRVSLSPNLRGQFVRCIVPRVGVLISALPFDPDKPPTVGEVRNLLLEPRDQNKDYLSAELLHAGHMFLGDLQKKIFGHLGMHKWPLAFVAQQAGLEHHLDLNLEANPRTAPVARRRHSCDGPEALALLHSLLTTVNNHHANLCKATKATDFVTVWRAFQGRPLEDKSNPHLVFRRYMSTGSNALGLLGFQHFSLMFLSKWVDALPGIYNRADIEEISGGMTRAECAAQHLQLVSMHRSASEILGLLFARNQGLAGSLAQQVRHHTSRFDNYHNSHDLGSQVREEMLRVLSTYDYRKNNRFSTYAMKAVSLELRRKPFAEQQLIRLSSEQTTIQPRIAGIALACHLSPTDANYTKWIADTYNKEFALRGRKVTPAEVIQLLGVGQFLSVHSREGEDGETMESSIADQSPNLADETISEIAESVNSVMRGYSPSEELVLSILLQASKPLAATTRFVQHHSDDLTTRVTTLLKKKSTISSEPSPAFLGGPARTIRIWPGVMAERAIRTKASEELARHPERTNSHDD